MALAVVEVRVNGEPTWGGKNIILTAVAPSQNHHRRHYSYGQTVQNSVHSHGYPKISEQPCAYHGTGHNIEDEDNPCQKSHW